MCSRQLLRKFLIPAVAILASCTGGDDDFDCPVSPDTVITGLGQSTLLALSDAQLEFGQVQYDIIQMTQPVQADRFMLAVVANAQFVASRTYVPESLIARIGARIGNFFVAKAHAITCSGPEFFSQQTLADITITSDAAVSAVYPAGSNLASVFIVRTQYVSAPLDGATIDSIITPGPHNRLTITQYLSSQPQAPLLLAMTLDIDDPLSSQHVLTVTYTLEDGRIYTTQTDAVSITP